LIGAFVPTLISSQHKLAEVSNLGKFFGMG